MAKKTLKEVKVGLFVLSGIVLACIFIFSIGSEQQLFKDQYRLNTNFKDVGGLRVGAPIRLAGVDVGMVSEINFLDDLEKKTVGVVFKVNSEVQERIREDSEANIKTMGVLGDKYISINIGSPEKKILNDGDFITSVEAVNLYDYLDQAGTIVNNIESITDSLNAFLSPIKKEKTGEKVADIVKTIEDVVKEVRDGKGTLHSLIYGGEEVTADTILSLNESLAYIKNILAKIDAGEGTLGALINDPTAYEDLKIILGGAKRSKVIRAVIDFTIKKNEKEQEKEKQE